MRKAVVSLALVFCGAALATDGAVWTGFRSDPGRFAISFPGKPQAMTQTYDTKVGKVLAHIFVAPHGNELAYFVAYNDYPADRAVGADPQAVLQGGKQGLLKNGQRTLTSERSTSLGGHPGLEMTWKTPEGHTGIVRVFLAKNRLYQVMVMRRAGTVAPADYERFLGSFRIL